MSKFNVGDRVKIANLFNPANIPIDPETQVAIDDTWTITEVVNDPFVIQYMFEGHQVYGAVRDGAKDEMGTLVEPELELVTE